MTQRLSINKTYKLYMNGAFPRTESGRSMIVEDRRGEVLAHLCHGSRKDLRDAVEAATKAVSGWAKRTAYNRAQILYRMAEMLEGKRGEFIELLRQAPVDAGGRAATSAAAEKEVDHAIDRLVAFAGWADKYAQILGCNNPVAGPHYNFTIPEPTGVVAIVPPAQPALLGMVSMLAPVLCGSNAAIVISTGNAATLVAAVFGEVCATSDVPSGVVNIITTEHGELDEHIAGHRGIHGISATNGDVDQARTLQLGAAENIKRVSLLKPDGAAWWRNADVCTSPWTIEPFVEMKTIWHPAGA